MTEPKWKIHEPLLDGGGFSEPLLLDGGGFSESLLLDGVVGLAH